MVRGRILRDTQHGNGLVSCGGQQYEFEIQKHWRSDKVPALNMIVDVELSEAKELLSLQVVDEKALAKEQAEKLASELKNSTFTMWNKASNALGVEVIVSSLLIWFSWVFLSTLSIQVSSHHVINVSFWNLLALCNNSHGFGMAAVENISNLRYLSSAESGLYGWIACMALLSPVVGVFWKDARAYLLYVLPLVLMAYVAISLYWNIHSGIESATESMNQMESYFSSRNSHYAENMMAKITKEFLSAVHLGVGLYIGMLASIVLAFTGLRKFLIAKAHEGQY